MEIQRARWPSKFVFLFAAIGSAVGLGNVWRFPYMAGKYGGGAFLIPYLIMLLVLGIPLLIMEFAIGQKMQLGAVGSFRKIRRKMSGIGLAAVLCGFVIVTYYAVIMAWCLLYTVYSVGLGWGDDPKTFLFDTVLHFNEDPAEMGTIQTPILLALVVAWLLIYFSVWKGVKSVSKVVMVTMPLPIIILIVLAIRGITLEGGVTGIAYYLRPNMMALLDPSLWTAAASQIFFTLTIAFGVMIAYASFRHESSDITKSAIITAVSNSLISILAGFAVFGTLGYMATKNGVDIESIAKESSITISFVVFPTALSTLPFAPVFALAFFLMLVTLAIDSAFSLVEAFATVLNDRYPRVSRKRITLGVCVASFVGGIIFTTCPGLIYFDIVDHFINAYGLVTVGLLEALAVGWLYGAKNLREYINEVSDIKIGVWWDIAIKFVIPVILITILGFSLHTDLTTRYEDYPLWSLLVFGWGMLAVLALVSFLFAHFSHVDEQ